MKKIVGILSVLGLVASASAIDWGVGTADWNVGGSWVGGSVPSGTTAAIINGGTAQITGNVPNNTLTILGNGGGSGNVLQTGGTYNAGNVPIGQTNGGGAGIYTKTGCQ